MLRKAMFLTVVIAVCVWAQRAENGTTGRLSWNILNGMLTISGNGVMPDYKIECHDYVGTCWSTSPWNGGGCLINIVVQEGVTSIGDIAFAFGIGHHRTYNFCEAEFSISEMMSITIGSTVASIGNNALVSKRLETITIYAKIPPQIGIQQFEEVYINPANVTLYVPAESVEKYKAAPVWRDFNIKARFTAEQQRIQDSIAAEQESIRIAAEQRRKQDSIQTEGFRIRYEERRREQELTRTREIREWQERISDHNLQRLVLRTPSGNAVIEVGKPFLLGNFIFENKRIELKHRSSRIGELYINNILVSSFALRLRDAGTLVTGINILNKSELGFGIFDVR